MAGLATAPLVPLLNTSSRVTETQNSKIDAKSTEVHLGEGLRVWAQVSGLSLNYSAFDKKNSTTLLNQKAKNQKRQTVGSGAL